MSATSANAVETISKEPKYCPFAMGHLNHQLLHNRVSACFRCSESLGDYRLQTMSEIMNSPLARAHRKKLMSGEWPDGCGSCKDYESQGQPSTRQHGFVHADHEKMLQEYNTKTGAISRLRSIELRFGNECNLTCRHCNTVHSSKWEALVKREQNLLPRLHRQVEEKGGRPKEGYFEDVLVNIVPGLHEIMFAGGETLYQKAHYKFIDAIPVEHAAHIELLYVTNGTLRSLSGWDLTAIWRRFKNVNIIVSTDGVGERYEYFRVGARWPHVEENIRYWRDHGFVLTTEITCSVYQMFYLIETLEYLYESRLANSISSSLVQYPPVLNPRIIPKQIKKEIKHEWDQYLLEMKDLEKLKIFQKTGQHLIDYMMHDELDIYNLPNGHWPTWKDFEQQAYVMDELFKTDIKKAFPRIAKTFQNAYS